MKKWIYIFGCVLCIIMLSLYFIQFNVYDLPLLSNSQGDWASFGSYASGTLGPIFAFLAFWGIKEQLSEQKLEIERQAEQRAFDLHINGIKDTFFRVNELSKASVVPLENNFQIRLSDLTKKDLLRVAEGINCLEITDDVIDAARLIQGARFIYERYTYVIDSATRNLKLQCPLNEHLWIVNTTWREFEKRALFLSLLASQIHKDIEFDVNKRANEYKEIIIFISAYALWSKEWENLGLGF